MYMCMGGLPLCRLVCSEALMGQTLVWSRDLWFRLHEFQYFDVFSTSFCMGLEFTH